MTKLYDGFGNYISAAGDSTAMTGTELAVCANNPTPAKSSNAEQLNPIKFPFAACMGNEYLNGWYKKLFYGQPVTISVDGDSTTQEEFLYMNPGKRAQIVEKIMRLGGYPEESLTVYKNGNGSKATGDYVGRYYSADMFAHQAGGTPNATSHPNGLLATTMAQNPDLIIFGYGLNDYGRYQKGANGALWDDSENLDMQGRIDLFRSCIEEFLQRLRSEVGTTINGHECYGKTEYDTAVILCVPITRAADVDSGWSYYCRKMMKDLAREYHCGVFDPTIVNYDHGWNNKWTCEEISGRDDNTHPAPWTNADFMSAIQPLLFPMGLWFGEWEQSHKVSYNLTGCSLSYAPVTLRSGVKLETYITADNGLTMQNCTVTMGGNTVSNAYSGSNGYIQVSGVNGDIVITATAN